jgi:hypothetical protein
VLPTFSQRLWHAKSIEAHLFRAPWLHLRSMSNPPRRPSRTVLKEIGKHLRTPLALGTFSVDGLVVPDEYRNQPVRHVVMAMNSIGWFVPPYGKQGKLDIIGREINMGSVNATNPRSSECWDSSTLPDRLAFMVFNLYAQVPAVDLYKRTIAKSVAAHFCGLHHVAVAGLMPVVEGAGRELARGRGLEHEGSAKAVLIELINNAKEDAWTRRIGNTKELTICSGSIEFLTRYSSSIRLYIHC